MLIRNFCFNFAESTKGEIMKRRYFAAIGILLIAIAGTSILIRNEKIQYNPQPADVIIVDGEDEDSYIEREKWIEHMHRAAPGVDWKEIDRKNIKSLRESRTAERLMKSGSSLVDIAGGRLLGEWNEKGSHNLSGRMHCIDVDFENGHVYGASSGGQIWRGTLEGENWISLSDYNQVKDIVFIRAMKKNDGSVRVMMATNNGSFTGSEIFQYSDDNGNTWHETSGIDMRYYKGNNLVRAVSTPDNTIYLLMHRSGRSYVLKSTNLGGEFTEIDNFRTSSDVDLWAPRFDEGGVYLVDQDKLLMLGDNGQFARKDTVSVNFSTSAIERIQLNGCIKQDTAHLYVMYRLDNTTRFIASHDGGENWSIKEDVFKGPFMTNSFGVSTVDPNLLGFGEVNAHRSTDGGKTWEIINGWGEYYGDMTSKLHADIPEIEFIKKPGGGELCFVSTDGGTYVSETGLESVRNISLKGLHVSQYYSVYTNRENTNIIYVGSQDQGFQRAVQENDGVVDFEQTISGDYGHIVSSDGGKSLWTVYPGFAMRYPNAAGDNRMVSWDFTGENHFWMPPLMADPYFPERVYLAGGTSTTGNHLWYLNHKSSGIDVTELPNDFSGGTNARISAMAFSPINKDYRYVLNSDGKFFYSSDRGTSWEMSASRGPGSHYFYGNSIVPDVNDINTIYIGGSGYSGYSVWASEDGGKTFLTMSKGLPNTLVFEMAINEDGTLLFAATEVGPFVWIKSEGEWFDLSGGVAPEQTYWTVDYVPSLRTARFGTYGRGIWDFEIIEYTGMPEIFVHRESIEFSLYPNPMDGNGYLQLNIPEPAGLSIRVLNQNGQIMSEKKEERLPSGPYSTYIDGQNLAPGMYYLQVICGNRVNVKKFIRR
jgi:hypothetical protein